MKNTTNKFLKYTSITLGLLIIQQTASKVGGLVANLFTFKSVDPQNLFASVSVHHVSQALIALLIIIILKKVYNISFGFKLGRVKQGLRSVGIFTIILLIYIIASYIIGDNFGLIEPLDFPLNARNVLGTLGFQLFLSGPSEEILFRALPITILLLVFKKSIIIKWGVSLETIIGALLFSIAHITWSLAPFVLNMDCYQLVYAFVLGLVYGKVYQESESILYPMVMHSISNVLYVGIGYLFVVLA